MNRVVTTSTAIVLSVPGTVKQSTTRRWDGYPTPTPSRRRFPIEPYRGLRRLPGVALVRLIPSSYTRNILVL